MRTRNRGRLCFREPPLPPFGHLLPRGEKGSVRVLAAARRSARREIPGAQAAAIAPADRERGAVAKVYARITGFQRFD
jgi:hypothetical protein